MATRRPARLYQKSTGVFFIRVLLPASKKGTKKPELRRSLRTRSLVEARSISSYVNALLERTPNEERANVINNLLPHAVSTWTLPGGISAEDEDDQRRLLDFMAQRPEIAKAIVEQMQARTRYLNSLADRTGALATGNPPSASPQQILLPSALAASPVPSATMRLSSALKAYRYRYAERFEKHKSRTADDKESLFDMLRSYLEARYPELGADPLLHQIDSRHLDGFLHEQEKRPGKHKDLEGNSRGLAPRTMLKKASDLTHFFEFAKTSEKVILVNPMLDLADALEAWQMQASQEDNAYAPFTSSHLQSIFEPRHYLSVTRDADHFWCPLLGAPRLPSGRGR